VFHVVFQKIATTKTEGISTAAGAGDVAKKPDDASGAVEAPQQKDSYDDFELPKKKKKRRPVGGLCHTSSR